MNLETIFAWNAFWEVLLPPPQYFSKEGPKNGRFGIQDGDFHHLKAGTFAGVLGRNPGQKVREPSVFFLGGVESTKHFSNFCWIFIFSGLRKHPWAFFFEDKDISKTSSLRNIVETNTWSNRNERFFSGDFVVGFLGKPVQALPSRGCSLVRLLRF